MTEDSVSTTLTVDAPAATVFAVPADPAAHAAIDGTGRVRGRAPAPAPGGRITAGRGSPDR